MIYQVYSVYDKTVGAYLPPFMCRATGEAIRSFTEAVNDPQKSFGRYAMDYTLVYLGTFNDNNGCYESNDPSRVITAAEVLISDEVMVK